MIRIGLVIVISVIVISIIIANIYYLEAQPNIIVSESGTPVQVGKILYSVQYIGNHNGNEDKRPENTYFKIQIIVENPTLESARMHGGQFYLLEENDKKIRPEYGNFSEEDLLEIQLLPNESSTWTTQFDIQYDEEKKYRIGILPTKEQASKDIGIICVQNC